ncbi:unnamed protein product [Pylaiella littoralis]
MRGITYTIRSSLYVAVTNRCCTTSLIASRGPGLSMPPSFDPLPLGAVEPSAADIIRDVTNRLSGSDGGAEGGLFDEVVFAGVGDPLLRWPVVREVVLSLRSRYAKTLLRPRASSPVTAAAAAATVASHGVRLAAQERSDNTAGGGGTTSAVIPPAPTTSRATTPQPLKAEWVMPVRLITNGLWPVVADNTAGSCCPTVDTCRDTGSPAAAMSYSERRISGTGEEDDSGRREEEEEKEVFATLAEPGQSRSIANALSGISSGRGSANLTLESNVIVSAASVAREVAEVFDSVSVALNTADPEQYEELMKPSLRGGLAKGEAHALVCDLVRESVAQGLPTECTVVDRDGVDVRRAEELAAALGASCRVRPYFPQ